MFYALNEKDVIGEGPIGADRDPRLLPVYSATIVAGRLRPDV